MMKVAVVLSGCGFKDGSEIHEAVSVLIHLSRAGAEYQCFAPDKAQATTINHATGTAEAQARNCLVEAARISRGQISRLSDLDVGGFDAVVFPGGFGAALNLCSYGTEGAECSVDSEVTRVIRGFHAAGKPIGLCCIAPVLAARVLGARQGGPGCRVTVGEDAGTAKAIGAMGSVHIAAGVKEAVIDRENRLVTSPAYMFDARPHEVFEGIGKMVAGVMELAGVQAGAAGRVRS